MYTEVSISVAMKEVRNGKSVYKTAKKYHMSTSMLRKRYKKFWSTSKKSTIQLLAAVLKQ